MLPAMLRRPLLALLASAIATTCSLQASGLPCQPCAGLRLESVPQTAASAPLGGAAPAGSQPPSPVVVDSSPAAATSAAGAMTPGELAATSPATGAVTPDLLRLLRSERLAPG